MLSINDMNNSGKNSQDLKVINEDDRSFLLYIEESSGSLKFASISSWIVNWFLLVAKLYLVIVSGSKAVTAALVDSAVDLVSQAILSIAQKYIHRHSPDYPVGRSRLEALSVLGCACIMSMASVEVIQFSLIDIYEGVNGHIPTLDVSLPFYLLLALGLVLKFGLYVICRHVNRKVDSDQLEALTEDHFNDIISNSAAMFTAIIAFHYVEVWWFDPFGAIFISVIIIYRWSLIMSEQVKKVVGYTAPPEFVSQVTSIAENHDSRLQVDCVRAYHFGARFNVEMEVVMPANMTVAESHDIALALQHKLEGLKDVERAFVHVDHLTRDGLEHKVERELAKSSGSYGAIPTTDNERERERERERASGKSEGLRSRHKGQGNSCEDLDDIETDDV
eukprot:CAMPEP_0182421282 /NCGR_PEP_ID=MMETSP1167-20130531/6582_1 /TAXON_ID=2988 /ORGANISM="Mallomonas Sp, Strain CCMP3275" /LENGTH=390 /DNA_ID=CAMNT_0024598245 /DNA_START=69 /DNA_END=1241 /DNA_ORIENTATION=+